MRALPKLANPRGLHALQQSHLHVLQLTALEQDM